MLWFDQEPFNYCSRDAHLNCIPIRSTLISCKRGKGHNLIKYLKHTMRLPEEPLIQIPRCLPKLISLQMQISCSPETGQVEGRNAAPNHSTTVKCNQHKGFRQTKWKIVKGILMRKVCEKSFQKKLYPKISGFFCLQTDLIFKDHYVTL